MSLSYNNFKKSMLVATPKNQKEIFKKLEGQQKPSKLTLKKLNWLRQFCSLIPSENSPTSASNTPYQVTIARKYLQLHKSAKKRDKDFNLTLKDLHKLLQVKSCYYTNKPFDESNPSLKRTIDRIDCSKGYIKGNVVACTHLANQLKNSLFESPQRDCGIDVDFYNKVMYALQKSGENDE